MVGRRRVLAGISAFGLGAGIFAFGGFDFGRNGSGNGSSMDTNGEGQGCRSGIVDRPENGTFKFINIVQFGEVDIQISVEEGTQVDEIVIASKGDVLHTEMDVKAGRQEISFSPGEATKFDVIVRDDGSVIDNARFYSTCSTQSEGDTKTASS